MPYPRTMPAPARAGGGGCCTLASTPRRWKPRNHAEQQCRWRPRLGSHVRRPPSPHMGDRPPHTPASRKAHISNENQPSSYRGPALPCATPTDDHAHQTHHTTPYTEIGPRPPRDRPDSAQPTRRRDTHNKLGGEDHIPHLKTVSEQQIHSNATDLEAGCDRSRAGTGPNSTRVATDLEPEPDRSRAGLRPISVRNRTDLEPGYDRSRAGLRPISTRNWTDLGAEADRSRWSWRQSVRRPARG